MANRLLWYLRQLFDVDVTSTPPADQDSLTWDAGTQKWIPRSIVGGLGATGMTGPTGPRVPGYWSDGVDWPDRSIGADRFRRHCDWTDRGNRRDGRDRRDRVDRGWGHRSDRRDGADRRDGSDRSLRADGCDRRRGYGGDWRNGSDWS
jgi:hypothetical protein